MKIQKITNILFIKGTFMKKRTISIFIFCIFILFSGCKADNKLLDSKSPISITIWHYYNGSQKTAFDKLISEFNETVGKENGIIVEALSQGSINDLHKSIIESANKKVGSDEMPDIFASYVDTAKEVDALGMLAELDKYFTNEELSEYIDNYIEEGRFDKSNTLKVFPVAKSTEIMMINNTDWKKFADATGADYDDLLTWEGIVETAEKYYNYTDSLTDEPYDGKSFFGRDAFANYMIVGTMQLGNELYKVKDENVSFDADKNVIRKLWDNFYIPYINGFYGRYGRFSSDDAKTGAIISLVCSSSGAGYFPASVTIDDENTYLIDFKILPLPNFKDTKPYAVQQGAGFAVTKSDDVRESACVMFLKWFTEVERNIKFAGETGYLPVKKKACEQETIEKVIQENNIEFGDKVKEAFDISLYQIRNYTLYTYKDFKNGYDARNVLENFMVDKAKGDRKLIDDMIIEGVPKEKAIAMFDNDENFEKWFEDFTDAMNKAIN